MTGSFSGPMDFDPNVVRPDGSDILTPPGPWAGYIAKYAPDNTLVWARPVGSNSSSGPGSVAVDGAGNVHVSGEFSGQAAFGSTSLTAAGPSDAIVTKLDANGNFLWAKNWGASATGEHDGDIAIDASGNVFTAGTSWSQSGNTISYTGFEVRKYSPTGAVTWSKRFDNSGGGASSLATDAGGNVYVAGGFFGTLDFNPDAKKANYVTGGPNSNGYVLKLTAAGTFGWVAPFLTRSTQVNSSVGPDDLALDAAGNIVVGGTYIGQVDFNPSASVDTRLPNFATFTSDGFVARLSPAGSLQWATPLGCAPVKSLAVDAAGAVYATGTFYEPFVPGFGLPTVTSQGGTDVFVTKLTTTGAVDWAVTFGGTGGDYANGIAVDAAGNLYLAGNYSSATVDFDPDPVGTHTLTNPRGTNMFLLKLRRR
ncbi:hypothetical protein EP7_002559 [Isosphaeraceae bacterium EP7]